MTWAVTQEIKLDELIKAKTVSRNSSRDQRGLEPTSNVESLKAKRVGRALACRADRTRPNGQ